MKLFRMFIAATGVMLISTSISNSQTGPSIEWQLTLGGNAEDDARMIRQTNDGGYIIGGYSGSDISGNKTENSQGARDYWVVKIDSNQTIQWQNTVGGDNDDILTIIEVTDDGGYICGGYSFSGISGDKTDTCRGVNDFWIIKLDATGNIIWQQTIGGSDQETLLGLQNTFDRGFIVCGASLSGISGEKTENNIGGTDFWIVKLDSIGNKEWDRTIGGSNDDVPHNIMQTSDSGYVSAGYSLSGVSGDKTEANQGAEDYWVIKLDKNGNLIWQNNIGGSGTDVLSDLTILADGNILIGGHSSSFISGDKTEDLIGQNDLWVLELDPTGSIIWQNSFGGSGYDNLYMVAEKSNNDILIASGSNSDFSGDKSQNSIGNSDYWVVCLDSLGNNKWQKTMGGSLFDVPYFIEETDDTGIICCGWSTSDISGDKNQASYGGKDYWIIKLSPFDCSPSNNSIIEISCENLVLNGIEYSSSGSYHQTLTNNGGCDSVLTLNFTKNTKPDFVSLGSDRTTALCPNDSVKIFVVNPKGPGLTYQWYRSDAIVPGAVDSFFYANEVRKYKVKVSAGGSGCERMSGRIQPTVAIPPSVSITPQGSTDICAGDSVLLVANYVRGYSYQWRRYGVDIPGATDTMYYASQPGNYKIFITNDGGCISKSSNVSVNIVCRISGSSVANDVEVMPNPTSNNFSVKLNDLGGEVPVSVDFIDQKGILIESSRVNGQTLIDFTAMGLSNGNYTVIVRFESGETVEKVVSIIR